MTKRMLIDASHPEETRVVVMDGNRLEAFDIESANRLPLKGNIYLARVVRVEPSLQAAFVEYGGNRHGFLAFGEIHPDYYQLPVADRQRLIEMQQAEAREEREREEAEDAARANEPALNDALAAAEPVDPPEGELALPSAQAEVITVEAAAAEATVPHEGVPLPEGGPAPEAIDSPAEAILPIAEAEAAPSGEDHIAGEDRDTEGEDDQPDAPPPETVGGSTEDEARERRIPPRFLRHYKIQEVIKRRQIMLIQVVKEERGTKGAALTTYISLAGRFSVLMPNSPRGGGVSRKITSAADRKRLREAIDELSLPDGMSLIVRTAGAQRPKPEIKRDCEYLLRLWDNIRERTFASTAPALIYEEADLIKRSIRDTYGKDVEEVVVDGEDAYQAAKDFMRMLMPAHAAKVKPVRDGAPLFARHGVDAQLDAMHNPTVQLKSGGYIVINQTEALVAIDVNSGRATRDRHIEDTALRTNLEAADEVARQLRLRDLAGLIVIDFIDMESNKHDSMVERRLKEALKQDRARIQVGRISHFGLLEMSRQRLRPSIVEHAYVTCPHCQGRGQVRSLDSSGLQVLRAIEEEGAKRRAAEIVVHVATPIAFWILNRKRERLAQIEERYGMSVQLQPDDTLIPPALRIEKIRAQTAEAAAERPTALRMDYAPEPEEPAVFEAEVEEVAEIAEARPEPRERGGERVGERTAERGEGETDGDGRRRRRRRRRGRRDGFEPRGDQGAAPGEDSESAEGEEAEAEAEPEAIEPVAEGAPAEDAAETVEGEADGDGRRRRRGRRGGRRRREEGEGEAPAEAVELSAPPPPAAPMPQAPPPRRAPTPADPFAGDQMDAIFLAMEAAEVAAEREAAARRAAPPRPVPAETPEPAAPRVAPPAAEQPAPEPSVAEAPVAEVPVTEAPAAAPPVIEPAAPTAPTEPQVGAPVVPIVLGGESPAELPRKRGWWRK